MTFKIAFVDPALGDYTVDTPRRRPLGGSQSALCYLAEELAALGLAVALVNGTKAPGLVRGVRCRPASSTPIDELADFDVVVLLNGCDPSMLKRLRARMNDGRRLLLWTQHTADEPAMRLLDDAEARACWDGFAFVSQWQMEGYRNAFGLDPARCRVLRNGVAPAFLDLFPPGTDILAAKPWPPVLAYTSTPFRGLDVLLDSVPLIRAAVPGARLRVFSSLEGYQVPAAEDPYADLYRRCRETDGVEYVGAIPQEDLARALREVTCLSYLNRFAETSCIAALEALAAGCLVLSSELGALPESMAGLARLLPVPPDPAEHARLFAAAAIDLLAGRAAEPQAVSERLRRQVDQANAELAWPARARDWLGWFEELGTGRVEGGAETGGARGAAEGEADVLSLQERLLQALHRHLNAGAKAGPTALADPGWQAEGRCLIDRLERSLLLEGTDEEQRSGVWGTLRGYDAWLGYKTALPDLPPPPPLPAGGRRIFDCFQFYNELDLLEVRLAELHPAVDRFVLVEASHTHAGEPKPLHYAENRARFAAWADKITHVVVEDDPGGFAWRREAHQRDAIARALQDCHPTDLILISDADEILRPELVRRLRRETEDPSRLLAPHLDIFLYFLDLRAPEPWLSVAGGSWELIRRIGPNRARYLAKQGIGRAIPDAGWHFTWMGGVERFRDKMAAYAHREMIAAFDGDTMGNQERLDRFFASGGREEGVPGMWTGLRRVPIDDRYPTAIRRSLDRFRRMGWVTPEPLPDPETLIEAGRARERAGDGSSAEVAYRLAVALDPAFIKGFDALSTRLMERGEPAAAIGPLRACVALDPWGSFHLFHLAHALLLVGRHAEAETTLTELVRREPADHRGHANLAVALKNLGRCEDAVAANRRSLALVPAEAGVLGNLGIALSLASQGDEAALRALARAIALDPRHLDTRLSLSFCLRDLRRLDEADAECRRILDIDPAHAPAHVALGMNALLRGELEAGFREYEWRTRLADGQVPPRGLPTPLWTGTDPRGLHILLHGEQGLGDVIQFARYAPLLQRMGARVTVECDEALVRLLTSLQGVEAVIASSAPTPPHDAHASLLSLPHLLGTTLATIPAAVPYIRAETALVDTWRQRLGSADGALRVGLIWAGNPGKRDDVRRSIGVEPLLPLLDLEGIRFHALQMGGGRRDLHRLPPNVIDLGAEISDLTDTAAIMACLDLIISVDTSAAHLAGALGRPVWTLLAAVNDWRWMLDRTDTPWYPTMRLFRQTRPGDWGPVIQDVADALKEPSSPARAFGFPPWI